MCNVVFCNSHQRCFVMEVMGRHCGWVTLSQSVTDFTLELIDCWLQCEINILSQFIINLILIRLITYIYIIFKLQFTSLIYHDTIQSFIPRWELILPIVDTVDSSADWLLFSVGCVIFLWVRGLIWLFWVYVMHCRIYWHFIISNVTLDLCVYVILRL